MGALSGGIGAGVGGALGTMIGGALGTTTQAPDYSKLQQQAQNNYNQQMGQINQLPANIQALFPGYQAQGTAAANALGGSVGQAGTNLQNTIGGLYSPTGPAVTAAQNANQTAQYANVPGSQDAVRQALAASGGFQRGNAGMAMAAPVLQAAQRTGLGNQQIQAQNLQQGQGAQAQAAQSVAQMSDQQAQAIFGMSSQQANQMLMYGTQAQQQQMTDMLQAGNNLNSQLLGIGNASLQSQYSQNAAQNALNNQVTGSAGSMFGQLFGQGMSGAMGGGAAGGMTGGTAATGLYPQQSGAGNAGTGATDLGGNSWGF